MKFFKTSNLSIQNDKINSNIFINELLQEYLDESKYIFYDETFDNIRKNMLFNQDKLKKIANNFYHNKNKIFIVRKKDNKIIKCNKIINNNHYFNYSYFIDLIKNSKKKKFYFCDNYGNIEQFKTINTILNLYFYII